MSKKYCANCGTLLGKKSKFCPSCGKKSGLQLKDLKPEPLLEGESNLNRINFKNPINTEELPDLSTINDGIRIKNNQSSIVKGAAYTSMFFFVVLVLTFFEWSPIYEWFALSMISFFLLISSLVVVFMFRSREKKLDTLIYGEDLLAHWQLNRLEKETYVGHLFSEMKTANKAIFTVISVIILLVFGIFIAFISEGRMAMTFVMLGLILFISLFAFGMPLYYKKKNLKGDGQVLVGLKYAYVNGFFHNWDFPLSGLSKIKIMKKPFYGLDLTYYFTDRNGKRSERLQIPANNDLDLKLLVRDLKNQNN